MKCGLTLKLMGKIRSKQPSLFNTVSTSFDYCVYYRGNVRLVEIDGPVVKLELEGACGTCPSSSMTMKMGLERKLKEKIPEIADVIQTMPSAPELTTAAIETVLDGVRPFLAVAGKHTLHTILYLHLYTIYTYIHAPIYLHICLHIGGKISIDGITGVDGLQPAVALRMEGTALALQSVKMEIMQRLNRHFLRNLKIDWV